MFVLLFNFWCKNYFSLTNLHVKTEKEGDSEGGRVGFGDRGGFCEDGGRGGDRGSYSGGAPRGGAGDCGGSDSSGRAG